MLNMSLAQLFGAELPTRSIIPRWLLLTFGFLCGVLGVVCIFMILLRQQVALRTQDLLTANTQLTREITERKKAEDALHASLQEKETLLRELYHRTKNTLQVIRSMLLLQSAKTPNNAQVQKLVKDTDNRILAIALVHQKLYQSQDLSRIQMQEYLNELAQLIIQSYMPTAHNISLLVESENLALLLDTAIPCGLIVHELLSNSLKYAFPDQRDGEISIRLSRNGADNFVLSMVDNGVGVPQGFDFRGQDTLGLQMVCAIAEHQMQGEVRFTGAQGVACTIQFPDALYTERV